ncbi:hypothetical protein DCAR_0311770 [Daucus carota subsp. sativus]|uniref:Protein FAR1-RELATED SEQUENCE n=1 Tax=Daucus carota subsp. sativus TaxID=79200 RepID=A0AAF0WPU2_DAUCS|nr:hypothetical protein DCAR_0311770 [Daucus carota subsp. sativus]
MVLKVGLEFETKEDAYMFYKAYAEKARFGIRRSKMHKGNSGEILDRVFGCKAKLGVSSRSNGKYRIYKFISEHSHDLVSPSRSHFLRSHRSLNDIQRFQIDMAQKSAGGLENVGFIRHDYKNYLRTKRTIQMKFAIDPNFIYAIQVDVEVIITNIFWADARMKVDYKRFGDVVCFETTYRKNKEGRPLALFVGVNNHKQTIIIGGALLYDETIETFERLFDTFSRTMFGRKPNNTLTDQDAAMDKALSTQWPETKHRLCVWHMYQNAAKHLKGIFDKFKSFAKEFCSCVYDHDEVSEFIRAWDDMLEKYNLKDNEWLIKFYENKEKWPLVYGCETFLADMSTTQHSESMNSMVKQYISYKHDLLQFFQHFQSLLDDRCYDEYKADTKSSINMPSLSYPAEILKHICCYCKIFEFVGILCAHSLKIFFLKNIKRVPDGYIEKRWTTNAKVATTSLPQYRSTDDDPKIAMGRRYKDLSYVFNRLAVRAAETEETGPIPPPYYQKMRFLPNPSYFHQPAGRSEKL